MACKTELLVLPALILLSVPVAQSQQASFEGLGDLSGGSFFSSAWGVSGDGTVVVGQSVSEDGAEAFRWEGGVMEGLGSLPDSGIARIAFGISADGVVVVGNGSNPPALDEAFRLENGVFEWIGDLPGGTFDSEAWDTSVDGAVVVGRGEREGFDDAAFRWENGTMEELPDLPGGEVDSRAYCISSDASIIVGSSKSANGTEAVRWVDTVIEGLGSPANGHSAVGYDCSDDGSVVVGEYFLSSPFRQAGFIWREGVGMEQLPELSPPGPTPLLMAGSVSGDGRVVAGFTAAAEGSGAFIWTAETGTRLLKSVLVDLYGLDLTGWALINVYYNGINADGTVIVGAGQNPQGDLEGWRAVLPPWPVANAPEAPHSSEWSVSVFPNPLRDRATVRVTLPAAGQARIDVLDVLGRVVAVLHKGSLAAGAHSFSLGTERLPAGVYVVRADFGKAGAASRAVTVLR